MSKQKFSKITKNLKRVKMLARCVSSPNLFCLFCAQGIHRQLSNDWTSRNVNKKVINQCTLMPTSMTVFMSGTGCIIIYIFMFIFVIMFIFMFARFMFIFTQHGHGQAAWTWIRAYSLDMAMQPELACFLSHWKWLKWGNLQFPIILNNLKCTWTLKDILYAK